MLNKRGTINPIKNRNKNDFPINAKFGLKTSLSFEAFAEDSSLKINSRILTDTELVVFAVESTEATDVTGFEATDVTGFEATDSDPEFEESFELLLFCESDNLKYDFKLELKVKVKIIHIKIHKVE